MPSRHDNGKNAAIFYVFSLVCLCIFCVILYLIDLSGDHYQNYQAERDICSGKIKSFLSNENAPHDTSNANYQSKKDVLDICLQLRSALADEMAAFYAGENHAHTIIGSFFLFLTTVAAGLAAWWAKRAVDAGNMMNRIAEKSLETELRAYIDLQEAVPVCPKFEDAVSPPEDTALIPVNVYLRNAGKTTAQDIAISIKASISHGKYKEPSQNWSAGGHFALDQIAPDMIGNPVETVISVKVSKSFFETRHFSSQPWVFAAIIVQYHDIFTRERGLPPREDEFGIKFQFGSNTEPAEHDSVFTKMRPGGVNQWAMRRIRQ